MNKARLWHVHELPTLCLNGDDVFQLVFGLNFPLEQEAYAAYMRLVFHAWLAPVGDESPCSVTSADVGLCRLSRVWPMDKWLAMKDEVLRPFALRDGRWVHLALLEKWTKKNSKQRVVVDSTRLPISAGLRFDVLSRCNFRCVYCGRPAPDVVLHVDHIHPVSKGGTNDRLNLTAACEDCNMGKRASVGVSHALVAE